VVTTPPPDSSSERGPGILSRPYTFTTIGTSALVFLVAFEALAVTTVMPEVARELDGVRLFALSFAAPLASGVTGMAVTGWWSDRAGATRPLLTSVALFGIGLICCGLAPTMPALVVGRLVQGLGGGGLTVCLYVVVGQVYPRLLQPGIFASFAAAWVLPALVGPAIAAAIAHLLEWRWVFLSVVVLVLVATMLLVPVLRSLPPVDQAASTGSGRLLAWAAVTAVAVLALNLLGDADPPVVFLAILAAALVIVSVRPLVPPGTLHSRPGLPSVILSRGALSASFVCAESFLPFVLQDRWGWSTGAAGAALAAAGLAWASGSQVQATLAKDVRNTSIIRAGSALLALGTSVALLVVWSHGPAVLLIVAYAVAAAGMGTAYPRNGVATLDASTDADRGFNSSALSIADSLGAALALSLCGIAFSMAGSRGFEAVYAVAVAWATLAVLVSRRTAPTTAGR